MTDQDLYKLRFPVGEFTKPNIITADLIQEWITVIKTFPEKIKYITSGLNPTQLNWKYRPKGWAIKQVVHHCADSHMNSLVRFKLALTEDAPTIKPYYEERWAELTDSLSDNITDSIQLLEGLHHKWGLLLGSLTEVQLQRVFIHPEHGQQVTLAENIGIYAWHCTHHLSQIKLAIDFQGKFN